MVEELELVVRLIMFVFVVGVIILMNLLEMDRGSEFKCFVCVFVKGKFIGFDWIKIYFIFVLKGIVVL